MRLRLALPLLAACLVGCGDNVCQKRASIAESCGVGFVDTKRAECEDAWDTCSNEERSRMNELYDCLVDEGYEECSNGTTTSGTSLDQITAISACEEQARKISDSCMAALGGGQRTTFTLEP